MKQTFFKTLTILLLSSGTALAQYVGAGGSTPLQQIKETSNSPWKHRFYINFGPSMPVGQWNREPDPSGTLSDMYLNRTGMGAKTGFYAELGNMFYLKRLKLPENMGVAINATYLNFSMHNFDLSSLGDQFAGEYNTRFIFYGFKLGAQFSYMLVKDVCFDAYFNLAPTFGKLGTVDSADDGLYNYSFYTDYYTLCRGIRQNIGLNARYKVFSVGLDLLMGGLKTDMVVHVYDETKNQTVVDEQFATKFRANSFQLKFGFAF